MKRREIIIAIVFLFLVILSSYIYQKNIKNEVCFEEVCFEVEIVDSFETRAEGLMFRESLNENKGMLFVFEKSGVYPFWMKNTLLPLDIIWIDENLEVVSVIENAVPCESDPCEHYNPGRESLYVLEINGGLSSEYGLGVGDIVSINN